MNTLREERLKRGWSQAELARRSRVTAQVISHLENDRVVPFPRWRKKLARALGLPVEAIFDTESEREHVPA